jgi:DNA-binding response OmpR family regulator
LLAERRRLFKSTGNFNVHGKTANPKASDVHMSRLRKKFDPPRAKPMIQTVRGSGYILK